MFREIKRHRILRQIKNAILTIIVIIITGYMTNIFYDAYMTSRLRFAILMLPLRLLCIIIIAISITCLIKELYELYQTMVDY